MKRVVAGSRAVAEAVRAKPGALTVVYVSEATKKQHAALLEEVRARGVRLEERPSGEIDSLAEGTKHQGIVAIGGEYAYVELDEVLEKAAPQPLLLALDEITDPHNLGAIVRSAVAFGADGVITLKDRAAPVTGVVVRASAGATEHARIARVTNLARTLGELTERGIQVVGLAAEGDADISALPPAPEGRCLVVGSEGKGLRRLVRERCEVLARISMPGPIASLNASVAAGIALAEAARERR